VASRSRGSVASGSRGGGRVGGTGGRWDMDTDVGAGPSRQWGRRWRPCGPTAADGRRRGRVGAGWGRAGQMAVGTSGRRGRASVGRGPDGGWAGRSNSSGQVQVWTAAGV
jgi:hypothetical protein